MDQPAPTVCPMCDQPVAAGAKFCAQCGVELAAGARPSRPARVAWYYNLGVILFLMLFVLGPFALPLVWKHPRLSRPAKAVLTVIGLGYAVVMAGLMAQLVSVLRASIDALNSAMPVY